MSDFRITIFPEEFHDGLAEETAEERASQGLLVVESDGIRLSAGFDNLSRVRRDGPIISAYFLAEWFLENWWRLCHEPKPFGMPSTDWWLSHCMTGVGEGYAWPGISFTSDGRRTTIRSEASRYMHLSSFGYYGAPHPVEIPWSSVRLGIDEFVKNVMKLTTGKGIQETGLDHLWSCIMMERSDPELGRFRRLEALLGADPDELPEESINARLADAAALGAEAVEELAAATSGRGIDAMPTSIDINGMSQECGVEMCEPDALALDRACFAELSDDKSAMTAGAIAAREARRLISAGTPWLSDRLLADIAGVSEKILDHSSREPPISFILPKGDAGLKATLRGYRHEDRRFNLARLVGDSLMWDESRMRPSTGSNTYRQKAQRAFAAELLAPMDAVLDALDGDHSEAKIEDVSRRFGVPDMVMNRWLEVNGIIGPTISDFDGAS